jgi:GTP cyclohydrolase-4
MNVLIDGAEQTVLASFSLTADLAFDRAGVHMSRFSEHLETAILDVFAEHESHDRLDVVLQNLALDILRAQRATAADVRVEAPFTLRRWTPASGRRSDETYRLLAHTRADQTAARTIIGVEVEGMTACPCAQLMMHEHGLRELVDAGFSPQDAERALAVLPAATHNQRSRGRLLLGVLGPRAAAVRIEDLVELVEQSMSSETYEVLKRPDEFFVVNKAHRNPKFVEDVVRGILMRALDFYEDLPDDTFVEATQINDESIHKHDAAASAAATFGELRAELRDQRQASGRSNAERWLGAKKNIPTA